MFDRLGLTLKVLREMSGQSQAALAQKARLGKSQLSKYESGRELPKLDSLARLLAALETTPLQLFYVHDLLEKSRDSRDGAAAALLRQHAGGPLFGADEASRYRHLFGELLGLFEAAVRSRVLDGTRA
jgi:transcriptional regulator with XRE-family HTH domain